MDPVIARLATRRGRAGHLVTLLLLGAFVAGMAAHFRTGLADNGDFTRSIKFFSSGPVGIQPNFPPTHTPLWQRRFYEHWLPAWTLRRHHEKIITSAVLLWLPGVLVAAAAGASSVTLPWLSIVPRLLLLAELWVLLRWTLLQPGRRWLPWTIVGPLVLIFTTMDNAAYLNTFYQEAASQVFLLPVLGSLVWLKARPTRGRLGLAVLALALLATAKSSTLYWPILALPFLIYAWVAHRPDRWRNHKRTIAVAGLAVACSLTAAARIFTDYHEANVNPYHSLFYGALMFSRHPAEQLGRLGLADGLDCIGVTAYQERGKAYFDAHREKMSFSNTISAVAHEPAILWRMGSFGLGCMQDISLEYLGKYAPGDPRGTGLRPWQGIGTGSEQRLWDSAVESHWSNLWSNLKYHFFPTGIPLAITLLAFAGCAAWRLRASGASGDLALVGLVSTLACGVDLAVAMLGEGRHEIIKHLYFANLLFDFAGVATVNCLLLWWRERSIAAREEAQVQMTSAKACLTRMNTT